MHKFKYKHYENTCTFPCKTFSGFGFWLGYIIPCRYENMYRGIYQSTVLDTTTVAWYNHNHFCKVLNDI